MAAPLGCCGTAMSKQMLSSPFRMGWRMSSLTPAEFGSDSTVYGRHTVRFNQEAEISGSNVTIVLKNTLGSPPTFNGAPTDYDLFR